MEDLILLGTWEVGSIRGLGLFGRLDGFGDCNVAVFGLSQLRLKCLVVSLALVTQAWGCTFVVKT